MSNDVSPNFKRFQDREQLEKALTEQIGELLATGIEQNGQAVLVVSGGRTPIELFKRLSQLKLDWSKVTITLADERWVPDSHQDSNAALVNEYLLQGPAKEASFLPHYNGLDSPHAGQSDLELKLEQLPKQFDVVILGMGEDGHTASFFPNAPELEQALNRKNTARCLAVSPPEAPHKRMTLSLPCLLNSQQVFLHLCGDSKLPVLDKANELGAVEEMPVRAILRQTSTPVEIYWAP